MTLDFFFYVTVDKMGSGIDFVYTLPSGKSTSILINCCQMYLTE